MGCYDPVGRITTSLSVVLSRLLGAHLETDMKLLKHSLLCVAALGVVGSAHAQFDLFAAETFPGSLGGNTASYGGVQQYSFASHAAGQVAGAGIAASSLHDPVGLTMVGSNLYVSNRFGNTLGQGSIQEFAFDGTNLSGGATIASTSNASFQGFHGFDFAPNGDLYVSTVNSGTRKYTDSGSGYTDVGGYSTGPSRDELVSPDGNILFTTTPGNVIKVTNLTTNSTSDFVVSGANAMHQMQYMDGALYVTGYNSGTVHKVVLDANYNPVSSSILFNKTAAIGMAFSPDGQEMFVSGHDTGIIDRYLWNGSTWAGNGSFNAGHTLGYLATYSPVPEPASMVVLGLGALAVLRNRRSAR